MVNEDWCAPRPLAYRSALSADWVPVRALFAELHHRFNATYEGHERVRHGQVMRCLYFTCVHPETRRQGVMGGLWRATVAVARERGYGTITAQASTNTTRRVLNDELGFSKVASVDYADYHVPNTGEPNALSGRLFNDLVIRDPVQYGEGLTIHSRSVPSNLYV